ncbi:MAG: class I SAM-dependent methyltransferase [Christensenellales bacterium]
MDSYLENMEGYWDSRFGCGGKVWGDHPSATADYAMKLFSRYPIEKILVPGAGYGRNTKLFSDHGYSVSGIEISSNALDIAKYFDKKTVFYNSSVLKAPINNGSQDAIYCFNVLHLFRENERKVFICKCFDWLKENGLIFFAVFSDTEQSYGKGKEVEENTFESKPGRPVHYFSEKDLRQHFSAFEVLETGIFEETECHGDEGEHNHKLAYLFAQKKRAYDRQCQAAGRQLFRDV